MNTDYYKVAAGSKAKLSYWKTNDDGGLSQEEGKTKLAELLKQLADWQGRLYAENKQALLIVLQARDAAGKDGTVKMVIGAFNPNGVQISNFKVPTEEELAHDFLWRVHAKAPRKGLIGVFNRSHYEDVLVTRVHNIIDTKTAQQRLKDILQFEELLTSSGTKILKFYLHISREEQKVRLQERLDDPTKNWKFNVGDLKEREKWDEYTDVYEDALSLSTKDAPWYVIPADRKWFRDLLISQIVLETLQTMNSQYPQIAFDPKTIIIK